MDIKLVADCHNHLGEGPLWDVAEQRLYWLDSMENLIFRATADSIGWMSLRRPCRTLQP